ncbi:MAG: alpha/beta hydrolase [Fimbriiglobus sp.]
MKVNLSFVPPGGGETDYSIAFDMPEIPRPGDYITIHRAGRSGTENFIVKRTWWNLEFDDKEKQGKTMDIWVECEFAVSPDSSEHHNAACKSYESKKGQIKKFDKSMY